MTCAKGAGLEAAAAAAGPDPRAEAAGAAPARPAETSAALALPRAASGVSSDSLSRAPASGQGPRAALGRLSTRGLRSRAPPARCRVRAFKFEPVKFKIPLLRPPVNSVRPPPRSRRPAASVRGRGGGRPPASGASRRALGAGPNVQPARPRGRRRPGTAAGTPGSSRRRCSSRTRQAPRRGEVARGLGQRAAEAARPVPGTERLLPRLRGGAPAAGSAQRGDRAEPRGAGSEEAAATGGARSGARRGGPELPGGPHHPPAAPGEGAPRVPREASEGRGAEGQPREGGHIGGAPLPKRESGRPGVRLTSFRDI